MADTKNKVHRDVGWLAGFILFVLSVGLSSWLVSTTSRLSVAQIGQPANEVGRGGTGWAIQTYELFYGNLTASIPTYYRVSDEFLRQVHGAVEWSASAGLAIEDKKYVIAREKITVAQVGTTVYKVEGLSLTISVSVRASSDARVGKGLVYLRFPKADFGLPYFKEKGAKPTLGTTGYEGPNQFVVPIEVREAPRSWGVSFFHTIGIIFTLALFIFFPILWWVYAWSAEKLGLLK